MFNFSQGQKTNPPWLYAWLWGYDRWLQGWPHATLVLCWLVAGFFLCSTLANRYHHWEQAQVKEMAASIAGEKMGNHTHRNCGIW
ncbi:hypothetical protein [Geitlerinema sp. PCC 9228]|uniref:hypothetical protein n=1 Tax=Geitlerinema sp. PCC 9228 TaxID=111611 RepID=UPI000A90AA17|nr:hypothetical protein [Geitlerinema sp. PCC 9228]